MSQAQLIEDVCVLASDISEHNFGIFDVTPNVMDNCAWPINIVSSLWQETNSLNGGFVNLFIVSVIPPTKGGNYKAASLRRSALLALSTLPRIDFHGALTLFRRRHRSS